MQSRHYDTLGVDPHASHAEISKAYRKLAMEHHPDRNNGSTSSEAKFKSIVEAYKVLSDPAKRASYDQAALQKSVDITIDLSDLMASIINAGGIDLAALFEGGSSRVHIRSAGRGNAK